MLLCCEHDLQGLGFPVGAPKHFFPDDGDHDNDDDDDEDDGDDGDDDDDDVLGIGNWWLKGLKPKAKFFLCCCAVNMTYRVWGFQLELQNLFFKMMGMMMMMMMMVKGFRVKGF